MQIRAVHAINPPCMARVALITGVTGQDGAYLAEWARIRDDAGLGSHLAKFRELLSSALASATDSENIPATGKELHDFVEEYLVPNWPLDALWNWTLEIWGPDGEGEEEEAGPVLCWAGAGAGVLPG